MEVPGWISAQMPFERREVVADGVRLSVVDAGPRDAPPILFVHGNPTWSFLWRKGIAAARAAGLRAIAPDHAGFGLSEKPEDPAYYSLDRHVRNLQHVARALDVRDATLVLHDWGGPIGMGLASREPERIARIVIANTTAFAPREKRAFTRWHQTFASPMGQRLGLRFNLIARSALRFGVGRRMPRRVRKAYDWPLRERGARIATGRFVQMVPDGPDHPEAATLRSIEAGYPKLASRPMLVLWADSDPVMRPRLAERWLRDFPGADVRHVAPEARHFWQEDAPEAFYPPIVEFARSR